MNELHHPKHLPNLTLAEEQLQELFNSLEHFSEELLDRVECLKCIGNGNNNYYLTLLGRDGYSIDKSLVKDLNEILKTCYEIPRILISEMRLIFEQKDMVEQACKIFVDFAIKLMQSQRIDLKLTTAVFHDLNILGYMFDRTPENYQICEIHLKRLITELYRFKMCMKSEDLIRWNSSTTGGHFDGQCLSYCVYISDVTKELATDILQKAMLASHSKLP